MPTHPLLIALADQAALRSISGAFAAEGRAHHVTTNGGQLLDAIRGGADVIVDPRVAPEGEDLAAFMGEVVQRVEGGRVLALEGVGLDAAELLGLGASDVFGESTIPTVVVRRLGGGDEFARRPCGASAELPVPSIPDALTAFTDRVGVRLVRSREREKPVAVFAVSVRGCMEPDVARTFRATLEGVLEELDRTQEMSYSAARMSTAPLGDDLHGVLIPDIERVQDAARLAVRLTEAMAPVAVIHVGIACSPDDGATATDLIGRARAAAERARRDGENHVEFHSDSMSRWAFERLTLEQSLRDALHNEELVVYYQPRVDIETQEIIGMEALVRWIHPQFGLVSPGQFIPLAEETGLIVPIGDWILRESCRQNAQWRAMGLPRIRVSVNLSPVQFRKPDLHEDVFRALDDNGLDADGLELEVTESLLMNDPAETAAILGRLRSRGIHISIDDFGTGYSSLSYLKRFPIDALKIDRSFVTDVTSNPDDAAIATAIILMGHSLKLSVVAEGVETENQLAFLKVLQCNEVQGYLFSPPVPADRARTLLEAQTPEGARSTA
ncbi:MAG: EAL domain-containing protein [Planctomycetota bacterium]|nr:EAL domain-containing protein [Planctomycetota bacterium]